MSAPGMRIDQALVTRELARSRTQAQKMVRAGDVTVDGIVTRRVSTPVLDGQHVVVCGDHHHVGRAAGKLIDALDTFDIRVRGRIALDAGASTGGFTQVLRERGAAHVFAVDVGHGQLAPAVAADPGVTSVEGVNLRWFERDQIRGADEVHATAPEQIDLIVGDLSFISLTQVLPRLQEQLNATDLVMLVKPQFEVGRGNLDRGGIVTSPEQRRGAIERVVECARSVGLAVGGLIRTSVIGGTGNQEFPIWLTPIQERAVDWRAGIDELTGRR